MLFNASTKYKNVDALDNHLLLHHGQVNGWTQNTSTHLHLSCDSEGFLKACKILSNRLTEPLFLHEHIEKEILAIDAEFRAKKHDAIRQLHSVQQQNCNASHPFSKFSSGNLATLSQLSLLETRLLLQKYHQKVMQGKYLSICIGIDANIGNQQIHSTLLQLLQTDFANIHNDGNDVQNTHNEDAFIYLPEHLNQFIQVKLDNDRHQLLISYILPCAQFTVAPCDQETASLVLCHLIESKHRHGLFHMLHTRKLATAQLCQLIHDAQRFLGASLGQVSAIFVDHWVAIAATARIQIPTKYN
jgi:secreted Zn-dependent insulinase-like peptidase